MAIAALPTDKRKQESSMSLVAAVFKGALIVGGIGFCAGFFGPMVFAPDANQGPLLGIFITGPLGAVLGAIGGFVYSIRQRSSDAHWS
jgi:hypothetical protein